ncbi:MAG: class I SAM-dependent methyltransferase, partial [Myxococcaceae bacterium]|nr:class I SAM-dependent methyltransferase [Myxococcaceae bacterium]
MPPNARSSRRLKPRPSARTADRFQLYEQAVQDPPPDIRLLTKVFERERGRKPLSLREDFCGTAFFSTEWVKSRRDRTAIGLDLHAPTLAYARRKHLRALGKEARRVRLLRQNVISVTRPPVDLCVAFNFSYCVFHDRPTLKRYLEHARRSLAPDGMFALDLQGGTEAFEAMED